MPTYKAEINFSCEIHLKIEANSLEEARSKANFDYECITVCLPFPVEEHTLRLASIDCNPIAEGEDADYQDGIQHYTAGEELPADCSPSFRRGWMTAQKAEADTRRIAGYQQKMVEEFRRRIEGGDQFGRDTNF